MYNKKSLPVSVLAPKVKQQEKNSAEKAGIFLGKGVQWNPADLINGHIVLIGSSGSGKTQTLKAIAYELPKLFSQIKIVIIDFHGDQELPYEVCYPLNMESPWGVNPLTIDLDTKGGGPALQAIAVAAILKKALVMGSNQEGLIIEVLTSCYQDKGITQEHVTSWTKTPPTFADVKAVIEQRIKEGCQESPKLALKLAATFQYGIFARSQPPLTAPVIRFDLSALGKVPGLGAIAAESLTKQLMDSHRLMGLVDRVPRTYLFIDEAKEVKASLAVDLVLADGRKYGINAVLASQRDTHISDNAIANSATKIILGVDQTEVDRVAKRFRFAPDVVAALEPLEALIRIGTNGYRCKIVPYYERILERLDLKHPG